MTTLITTLFNCSPARLCELRISLEMNRVNTEIDEFVFLCEGNPDYLSRMYGVDKWSDRKIELVEIHERAGFHDFFEHANRVKQGNVIVACNTDIYFDHTLKSATACSFNPDSTGHYSLLMALTRYNLHPIEGIRIQDFPGGRINGGSNDAWIFKAPIKRFGWDIKIGILGCDAYVAQRAKAAGLTVINPCLSVRAIHFHPSRERTGGSMLNGKTYWDAPDYVCAEVPPCKL